MYVLHYTTDSPMGGYNSIVTAHNRDETLKKEHTTTLKSILWDERKKLESILTVLGNKELEFDDDLYDKLLEKDNIEFERNDKNWYAIIIDEEITIRCQIKHITALINWDISEL